MFLIDDNVLINTPDRRRAIQGFVKDIRTIGEEVEYLVAYQDIFDIFEIWFKWDQLTFIPDDLHL